MFCLLFCQEPCESHNVGIDLLLLHRGVATADCRHNGGVNNELLHLGLGKSQERENGIFY